MPATDGRRTISIVSPCYNDAENLRECHARVRRLFETDLASYHREHIFADNNSTDGSPELLAELAASDPDVRVIFNARNVGVLRSTFNAMRAASGDACVPMLAVDLQDPPEVIAEFVRRWEGGAHVVYGVREKRDDSGPVLWLRRAFYRIMRAMAEFPVPVDAGEFQLIDRKVRTFVCARDDHNPYIRGLIASAGFTAAGVPYQYVARRRGFSKNRLVGLFGIATNAVLTFSRLPIRIFAPLGGLFAACGPLAMVASLVGGSAWLLGGLISLVGGLNMILVAIVGEYVLMTHAQVRHGGAVPERGRLNFGPQV
ncbi:MAG: glycosyltransferase [Alphaproteobacteria bacterium]|nr:glycosyltransferase [Alphaproteobacteria bacterium]